jgi:hypothetical protein
VSSDHKALAGNHVLKGIGAEPTFDDDLDHGEIGFKAILTYRVKRTIYWA